MKMAGEEIPGQLLKGLSTQTNYKGKPVIDSVLYNSEVFSGTITAIKEARHNAGIKSKQARGHYFSKERKLYMAAGFTKANGNKLQHEAVKKITIKGKLGKFKFSHAVTAETELTTPNRY